MAERYLPLVARFGLLYAAAWMLLALLPGLIPGPDLVEPGYSIQTRRPVAEMVAQAAPETAKTLAKMVGYGLLPALGLAYIASRQPGSALDRALMAPVILLMAIPPFVYAMGGVWRFALQGQGMPIGPAGEAGLMVAVFAWMVWAFRQGLAESIRERPGRALLSGAGQFLQLGGTLIAAVMLAELVMAKPGLGRLLIMGVMQRDYPVVLSVLGYVIVVALVLHLVGSLLSEAARGREPVVQPHLAFPARPVRGWLITAGGLLLTLLFLAVVLPLEPNPNMLGSAAPGVDPMGRSFTSRLLLASRISLTVAAAAAVIAVVGGGILGSLARKAGRWGEALLAPRFMAPSLLLPLVLSTAVALVARPSEAVLIMVVGLSSIPFAASLFRQATLRGQSLLGLFILVLVQAMLGEVVVSYLGLGVMPPNSSLGALIQQGQPYLRTAPGMIFWPAVFAATGIGSLWLAGAALTAEPARQDH